MILAAAQFREDSDALSTWLDTKTSPNPSAIISKSEFYAGYIAHCQDRREPEPTKQSFGRRLRELRPDIGQAQRTYCGVPKVEVYEGIEWRELITTPRGARETGHAVGGLPISVQAIQPIIASSGNKKR